ncbi:uncharacterized protein LOC134815922 [Bolinopsis microptera]|uniref:uncharacterized protein LOC134815922 n=1 Tax=Bolinopsis microptera TaxID=2820187 RepID=UPI0030799DF4
MQPEIDKLISQLLTPEIQRSEKMPVAAEKKKEEEGELSNIDSVKLKIGQNVKEYVDRFKSRYSKKRNLNYLCKAVVGGVAILVVLAYEISSHRLESSLYNPDDAVCEDLSEVNETMFEISVDALNTFRRQELRRDMKQDTDGSWLMTIDVNIGDLTAQDVNNFNKYINCSAKFRWLHPEDNEMSYWIESPREAQRSRSKQKQPETDQTGSKLTKAPGDKQKKAPGDKQRKQHHKLRSQHGKQHFHKFRRGSLSHGDVRRLVVTANTTSQRMEMIFNENICIKGGNPHICEYEEEAEMVYKARIQRTVVWLGNFKLGQISAAVIKDKEAGNNILRTKLAIGGGETRFTSSSFVNKIINVAAVPHASVILYDEIYAQNIYQHMMEESFISATIMQYLHED